MSPGEASGLLPAVDAVVEAGEGGPGWGGIARRPGVFLLQGGMSLAGWHYGNIVHLQTLSLKDDLISSRDFKGELLEREHLGVWESSRQRDHLWRSRRKNLTERIV